MERGGTKKLEYTAARGQEWKGSLLPPWVYNPIAAGIAPSGNEQVEASPESFVRLTLHRGFGGTALRDPNASRLLTEDWEVAHGCPR